MATNLVNRRQWNGRANAMVAMTCTIRVDGLGQLKGVGGGHVSVGRCDSQNETGVLADELHYHVSDLRFNIDRLIPNRDLGQTGKIDEGDAQHCEMRQKRKKEEWKEETSVSISIM